MSPTPTVPVIVYRAEDYTNAGQLFTTAATEMATTHYAVHNVLGTLGGMAGDDSNGQTWAQNYDEAAGLAMKTSAQLGRAVAQLRNTIVTCAHDHESADAGAHHDNQPAPQPPTLLPDPTLGEDVPSAYKYGGGVGEPTGWSLVKKFLAVAWPDGHQDQLHSAGAAWKTASTDFHTIATEFPKAIELLGNQQSTEIQTATTTCNDRQTDINDLGDACQTLGELCEDYAHQLDDAHKQICDELDDLVLQTAGMEVVFAIGSVLGPEVEIGGNAAWAARIGKSATKISEIIGRVASRIAEVAKTLKPLAERLKTLFARVKKWVDDALARMFKKRGESLLNEHGMFSRDMARTSREVLASGDHLPLTPETIAEYAQKAGLDLSGVEVRIASSEDDIAYYDNYAQALASTKPGQIILAPSAFADEETLMRTLVHENCHIEQYAAGRINTLTMNDMEDEAYRVDAEFWDRYTNGGK
ncbi:WXG100-like domain-containing protein [Nocardia stercoris]|uniref:Outer membrane channel protein CpnT-like N-terminal domain-containing protein n=1 Tax=Nocardia stercoris TaxID=2483361 RepID=A0A3M2KS60_9NOCA|nr:hypothetical protein [Nocardia stercoris]RMI28497.1 hypothetical protein EBN03_30060 [Nocardia stercoris]